MSYSLGIEGGNYVARNPSGAVIFYGADFSAVVQALNDSIPSGSTVVVGDGLYQAARQINETKQSVSWLSSHPGMATWQAAKTLVGNYMVAVSGYGVKNAGIRFDGNKHPSISPVVELQGSYESVDQCSFLNALQYNVEPWGADHWSITNCLCQNAQYGIATGGRADRWATDGYIGYNTVKDCLAAGIKVRWGKRITIEHNLIDCAYLTYTERYPGSGSSDGMMGLYYALLDGPCVDVVSRFNQVLDSKMQKTTWGTFMENEETGIWLGQTAERSSGMVFDGNSFSGLYYGVWLNSDRLVAQLNTVRASRGYGIWVRPGADYCQLLGNDVSGSLIKDVLDQGVGTVIEGPPGPPPPPPPPPQTYTISYLSQPVSVSASINGVSIPSGGVASIQVGATATIVVPPSVGAYSFSYYTVNGVKFTSATVSVIVNQNLAVAAYYVKGKPPKKH